MKSKLKEIPIIKDEKELVKYLKPCYVMEDYMVSKEEYINFQEKIYNIIKGCFEHKECREHMVSFKFYHTDKKTYSLQLRHFIVNIFLWYPFINLNEIPDLMDGSFIINCGDKVTKSDNDYISESPYFITKINIYINEKIIELLREYAIKNIVVNRDVSEVLYNMRRISIDFAMIMNIGISTEVFLKMYENEDLKKIMETQFPLEMQPSEIESTLAEVQKMEIDILKSIPDNPLGVILRSGTGIKHKQLVEFTSHMGLKPDLSGVTIPIPINSSTMIRGLDRASYLYEDAMGARKSLIMNKKVMGKAGHFGKLALLLARTLSLSKSVSDCGSRHYLDINIKDGAMLNKYNGRYYTLDGENILLLNSKEDKHLIGKTVHFRSPITCKCGDEVCHKCFGTTSLLNLDIPEGVSGFEIEEVTKVINQLILSIKHLLETISEKIEFNPEFYDFFTLYAAEITPILNSDKVDDLNNYAIWIDPNNIMKVEELDSDSSFNTYFDGHFYVQNLVTGDSIEMYPLKDKEMFLTEECLELLKSGKGYIRFADIEEEVSLFVLDIMNNELTKPLYDLMYLLDRVKKKGDIMTYHEMAQKFTELILEANMEAVALAGELIINRLIRNDPDDDFSRPDFSKSDVPPYQIYTIVKALKKNKSPLIGLSSQNIKEQILSDEFVTKKGATSYIDPLYSKKISTKRLYEIHNKLKKKQ